MAVGGGGHMVVQDMVVVMVEQQVTVVDMELLLAHQVMGSQGLILSRHCHQGPLLGLQGEVV